MEKSLKEQIKQMLIQMLSSKKFVTLIIGIVLTSLIQVVPAMEPLKEIQTEIVAMIVSYFLALGATDFGKEAKVKEFFQED